jgi:hypothetical protein
MAQWKYLETPLYMYSAKFMEAVASEVGGVLD